jgi:diguanylate cyclase (GGDEF)-like protein
MLAPSQFVELKASGKLPSPRGVALKVMEMCERDNVTLPELIKLLQTDPAMVGRILKIANSAAFARQRPSVALTQDVLMSIGIKTLRQVVLAFSLVSSHCEEDSHLFDYNQFWSKSIATGVATQLLGEFCKVAPAAEMFTVGLLSNIGQLALTTLHPEQYSELLKQAGDQFSPELVALEEKAFGHTHWDVSAAMMLDWGVPKLFTIAVLTHENSEEVEPISRSLKLALCLNLGARLSSLCFLPESQQAAAFAQLTPVAKLLGVDESSFIALGDRLLQEWHDWSALLNLSTHSVRSFSTLAHDGQLTALDDAKYLNKFTILIVDDDATACLLLKKFLTLAGHEVFVANDGDEGLAQALVVKPDIVITDIMMPNRNGLEMIKSLRETELGRFVYIIVLTMLDDKNKLAEAFSLGADDYLAKPVDKQVLQARLSAGLRVVTEQHKLRAELEQLHSRLFDLNRSNDQAQKDALIDVLTGLYNRRHALDRLAQEWSTSNRHHQALSILMIDIDHFKQINDRYGHDVGDRVLCEFAGILKENERVADIPCRFGGEEFIVILPGTNLEGALLLAERIRVSVENKMIPLQDEAIKLTVSIGVAMRTPAHTNVEMMIKAADKALYSAKNFGRNQLSIATDVE